MNRGHHGVTGIKGATGSAVTGHVGPEVIEAVAAATDRLSAARDAARGRTT